MYNMMALKKLFNLYIYNLNSINTFINTIIIILLIACIFIIKMKYKNEIQKDIYYYLYNKLIAYLSINRTT